VDFGARLRAALDAALAARGLTLLSYVRASPWHASIVYGARDGARTAGSHAPRDLAPGLRALDDWLWEDLLRQVDAPH